MPMPDIQPAPREDAAAILALQHLAFQSEARLYNDWSIPPLTETLAASLADWDTHTVLKAVDAGGRIVGSVRARVQDGECPIARLIVHPQSQGQGLGAALLQAIEAQAAGVRRFTLFTGARSEGNIRLYQRHGYRIVGTEAVSPVVSLVHMEKAA